MKEYILCAAVWYKEIPLVDETPLRLRGFSPYNVDKGIVFCGWRHPNCVYQAYSITGLSQSKSGESIQGFLTNLNRFVDREEAWDIAEKADQIIQVSGGKGTLYSEDLY